MYSRLQLALPCLCAAWAMIWLTWPAIAAEKTIKFETNQYASLPDFLQQHVKHKISIAGDLFIPELGNQKYPAAVIMPGASGITSAEINVAGRLRKEGYATLLLNRPAGNASDRPINLASFAFDSLKALASEPLIDPSHIVIVGISEGGISEILSNSENLRRKEIEGDLKFAVHIGFYPNCYNADYGPNSSTGSPMLFLTGDADGNAPARQCQDIIDLHKSTNTNSNITLKILDGGVAHGFLLSDPVQFASDKLNVTKCPVVALKITSENESSLITYNGGQLSALAPDKVASIMRSCSTKGIFLGGNPTAAVKALNMAVAFLKDNLANR